MLFNSIRKVIVTPEDRMTSFPLSRLRVVPSVVRAHTLGSPEQEEPRLGENLFRKGKTRIFESERIKDNRQRSWQERRIIVQSAPVTNTSSNHKESSALHSRRLRDVESLAERVTAILAKEAPTRVDPLKLGESDRYLKTLGIRSAEKRGVLSELLALAVAGESLVPNLRPGDKPKYEFRNDYPDRLELVGTNIVEFLRLVWGKEILDGLHRSELKRVDPTADAAVQRWLRSKPLPSDIKLMSPSDAYAGATEEDIRAARRLVRAAERQGNKAGSTKSPDSESLKAAIRLISWSNRQRSAARHV